MRKNIDQAFQSLISGKSFRTKNGSLCVREGVAYSYAMPIAWMNNNIVTVTSEKPLWDKEHIMLKFIVVVLASFMAVALFGSYFPSVFSSQVNIGGVNISAYFLSMVGTIFTFYKIVG